MAYTLPNILIFIAVGMVAYGMYGCIQKQNERFYGRAQPCTSSTQCAANEFCGNGVCKICFPGVNDNPSSSKYVPRCANRHE